MITLKTLPQATAQEVFDQVARHLLTQNEKSSDDSGCVYRTADGLACAAGCLMADDEVDDEWNADVAWAELVERGVAPKEHQDLIEDLQGAHDSFPTQAWPERLKAIADNYGLSTAVTYTTQP